MTAPRQGNERGLTLTELTVVIMLAGLVTVGLVTFYFNSQAMWIDGSTQAFTQREATQLISEITRRARSSSTASANPIPDAAHHQLLLYDLPGNEYRFEWNATDSLVHEIETPQGGPAIDHGPSLTSKVVGIQFETDARMIYVRRLALRTPTGQTVETSSSAALYNWDPGP